VKLTTHLLKAKDMHENPAVKKKGKAISATGHGMYLIFKGTLLLLRK
jgi:hypothetical protein